MLSTLFKQFANSIGMVFRTFKAFFLRQFTIRTAQVRRFFSFSRKAAKLAPKALQTVTVAGQKPTKREDFIETEHMFISKSLIVIIVVAIIAISLLFYFLVWPWIVSSFLTAKMVYTDKDITGYNGKVIVYYDDEKEIPMYSGTLVEGLLEGAGIGYDESGIMAYEGNYFGGLYEGDGKLYENGVLVYKGEFSSGTKDGSGKEYYPDGKTKYDGSFAEDEYNGEGTLYDENGNKTYSGGFKEGLYSGEGKVYLKNDQRIDAEFEAGESIGTIRWYKNSNLYYNGSAVNLVPNGYGTIYASTGVDVYKGQMKFGSIDGDSLIGLSKEDILEVLSGSTVTTTASTSENGFTISARELGMTVFCNNKVGDTEPMVYRVTIYKSDKADKQIDLFPWSSCEEYLQALSVSDNSEYSHTEGTKSTTILTDAGEKRGNYFSTQVAFAENTLTLLAANDKSVPVTAKWISGSSLPAPVADAGGTAADDDSAARLDALNEILASVEYGSGSAGGGGGAGGGGAGGSGGGAGGGGSSGSGSGGSSETQKTNPYYGKGDPAEILLAAKELGGEYTVLASLLDYFEAAESKAATEEKMVIKQELLTEEILKQKQNLGDADTVKQLNEDLKVLGSRAADNAVKMDNAAVIVRSGSGGLEVSNYDLQALIILIDPLKADIDALCTAAADHAIEAAVAEIKENLGETAMAPEVAGSSIDKDVLFADVKQKYADFEALYQALLGAQEDYDIACEALAEAESLYKTGAMTKAAFYSVQCTVIDCRAAVYNALTAYMRQLAVLDEMTGGWISSEFKWFKDVFAAEPAEGA